MRTVSLKAELCRDYKACSRGGILEPLVHITKGLESKKKKLMSKHHIPNHSPN